MHLQLHRVAHEPLSKMLENCCRNGIVRHIFFISFFFSFCSLPKNKIQNSCFQRNKNSSNGGSGNPYEMWKSCCELLSIGILPMVRLYAFVLVSQPISLFYFNFAFTILRMRTSLYRLLSTNSMKWLHFTVEHGHRARVMWPHVMCVAHTYVHLGHWSSQTGIFATWRTTLSHFQTQSSKQNKTQSPKNQRKRERDREN